MSRYDELIKTVRVLLVFFSRSVLYAIDQTRSGFRICNAILVYFVLFFVCARGLQFAGHGPRGAAAIDYDDELLYRHVFKYLKNKYGNCSEASTF